MKGFLVIKNIDLNVEQKEKFLLFLKDEDLEG